MVAKILIYGCWISLLYAAAPQYAFEISALLAAWFVFACVVFVARVLFRGIGRAPVYGSGENEHFFSRDEIIQAIQNGEEAQRNGEYAGWL